MQIDNAYYIPNTRISQYVVDPLTADIGPNPLPPIEVHEEYSFCNTSFKDHEETRKLAAVISHQVSAIKPIVVETGKKAEESRPCTIETLVRQIDGQVSSQKAEASKGNKPVANLNKFMDDLIGSLVVEEGNGVERPLDDSKAPVFGQRIPEETIIHRESISIIEPSPPITKSAPVRMDSVSEAPQLKTSPNKVIGLEQVYPPSIERLTSFQMEDPFYEYAQMEPPKPEMDSVEVISKVTIVDSLIVEAKPAELPADRENRDQNGKQVKILRFKGVKKITSKTVPTGENVIGERNPFTEVSGPNTVSNPIAISKPKKSKRPISIDVDYPEVKIPKLQPGVAPQQYLNTLSRRNLGFR